MHKRTWVIFVLFILYSPQLFSQFGDTTSLSIWIDHVDEIQYGS